MGGANEKRTTEFSSFVREEDGEDYLALLWAARQTSETVIDASNGAELTGSAKFILEASVDLVEKVTILSRGPVLEGGAVFEGLHLFQDRWSEIRDRASFLSACRAS